MFFKIRGLKNFATFTGKHSCWSLFFKKVADQRHSASDDYLVTINIEKTFDSLDNNFIVVALEKFGFKPNFIDCIKLFINGQLSCLINRGLTTKIFNSKEVHTKKTLFQNIFLFYA